MYANPEYHLTEAELRSFLRLPSNLRASLARGFGMLGLVALLSGGGYYLINLDAFQKIAQSQPAVAAAVVPPTPSAAPVAAAITATPTPVISVPDIPNNTVSFPSVNISAPITWDVRFDDAKTVTADLVNGPIQLAGTAHPGQHGTVIITGHSSNYPWIKGNYNSVFAPLENAKADETIEVSYNNAVYKYQVTKTYVVKPTQLDVLNAGSFDGLRLITCTPVGTSLNRLVVEAKQISPDPAANSAFTQANFSGGSIPSGT